MTKTVLVVDDSSTVREQVSLALVQAGYEVAEAIDGEDAAEKIAALPGLSMVLCDVNMPRKNGLELLQQLSEEGRLATLPVVMLTTEGQPELITRARSLGAKGWMVKPVKPELLVATVKKLAKLGRESGSRPGACPVSGDR
jgi:two-component system, chemotaxis family, chemotaxis protein CheY